MIEQSAGVQGRRPDRRHLRRGQPAVHLLGNSFNNANAYGPTQGDQPNAAAGIAADAAGENLFGKQRARSSRPARTRTLAHRRQRQPALPRPGRQRLHRPAAGLHRDRADQRAGELRAGHRPRRLGHHARRAHRHGRWRRPRRPTCSTARSWPTTPAAGDRHRRQDRARAAPARSRPNTFVGTVSDTGPQLRRHRRPARSSTARSSWSTRRATR